MSIYLNLSACYIKLKDFINAIKSTEEALLLDSKSTKALFRRAKARTEGINPV